MWDEDNSFLGIFTLIVEKKKKAEALYCNWWYYVF